MQSDPTQPTPVGPGHPWRTAAELMRLQTRWFTLIEETLIPPDGETLDYWRVERASSVIVIPLQRQQLLLPPPSYRPGVGTATLDFPGGRIGPDQHPATAAIAILERELSLVAAPPLPLQALNSEGWPINSSFSNQRLYGFITHLPDTLELSPAVLRYSLRSPDLEDLWRDLTCLQCRALLLEAQARDWLQPSSTARSPAPD